MLNCVAINTSVVSDNVPSAPFFSVTHNDSWYSNMSLATGYIYTCDYRAGRLGYISVDLTGTPFTINDAFSVYRGCYGGFISYKACGAYGEININWHIPVACAAFSAQVGGLCCDTGSSALTPRTPCTASSSHSACIPIRLAQRFAVHPSLWSSSSSTTPSHSQTPSRTSTKTSSQTLTHTKSPTQTMTLTPQTSSASSNSIAFASHAARDAGIAVSILLCLAFIVYAALSARRLFIIPSSDEAPAFAASSDQDLRAPLAAAPLS